MKIYFDGIIYSLQKSGGITRYTNELTKRTADMGHEITVVMHPGAFNRPPDHRNISIVNINSILKTSNKILKYLTYPFDRFCTEKYFQNHPVESDIFHSPYFSHYKNLKIPQVITVYDMINENFPEHFNKIQNKIFLQQKKKAILSADAIICISKQTSYDLQAKYNIDPQKIHINYLGVDTSFTQKDTLVKNNFINSKNLPKKYFLFVGNRSLYKNFERLIKAFAQWENKEYFSLITIGGGKFTDKEKKLVESLNLNNNIINFNFVTEEELVLFYNCAEAFIFPSLYEGFGLPIIEAVACGTTVLASDIPVFKEIGQDIPIYFNPTNQDSMINAFNLALNKNRNNIDLGIKLSTRFSWDNTAKKTMEIYKNLLK